jgi:chromosome partitioning protein
LIIIPLNPDPYSVDGLELTLNELKKIKKEFGVKFYYQILLNRYDGRERLGSYYMRDLIKDEDKLNHIMSVVIRVDTSLKNAIFEAKSIFELKQKSVVKEDIEQLSVLMNNVPPVLMKIVPGKRS